MDELRWGMTTKNDDFLGEYTDLKILAAQTIVIIIILVLIQPIIITHKTDDQKIPRINTIKLLVVTMLVVGGTYYIPSLLRS